MVNPYALQDDFADARPGRVPPAIGSRFDLLVRGWRPAMGWVGVAITALLGIGIASGLAAILWRAAITGQPVPDMTAGLTPLLVAIVPPIVGQITRYLEIKGGKA